MADKKITVMEAVKMETEYKHYWLCPNICRNMNIAPRKYETGVECDKIPVELADKELVKCWVESVDGVDRLCLIWRNE